MEKTDLENALDYLNSDYITIAQIAPALRVSVGELYNYPKGKNLTKKLVGALRNAGFKKVFDTAAAADLVTIEEGTELIKRLRNHKNLPLFTSCCIQSILFIEREFPHFFKNFCTVKSPQQTMGTLIKNYYAKMKNIPKNKIKVIAIMPCTVKKLEAKRQEMHYKGERDVDAVITTTELKEFFKKRNVDFKKAKEQDFDYLLGEASGAGQGFGTTGGVSDSLLRFVSRQLGDNKTEFKEVRGMQGIRERKIKIGDRNINIAIIHGIKNIEKIMKNKEFTKYQVLEMMACNGGCIGGPGQPKANKETLEKRRKGLLKIDQNEKIRQPAENPEIVKIYRDYFGYPGSKKALDLLHARKED